MHFHIYMHNPRSKTWPWPKYEILVVTITTAFRWLNYSGYQEVIFIIKRNHLGEDSVSESGAFIVLSTCDYDMVPPAYFVSSSSSCLSFFTGSPAGSTTSLGLSSISLDMSSPASGASSILVSFASTLRLEKGSNLKNKK